MILGIRNGINSMCSLIAGSRSVQFCRHKWLLAPLLAIAFVIRCWGAGDGALWLDEGYTVIQARSSIAEIFARELTDPNPPLSVVIFHIWSRHIGDAFFNTVELSFRSLSIVFGMLSLVVSWRIARRLMDVNAVNAFLLLLALSAMHVHLSQQARIYAVALFVALLCIDSITERARVDWFSLTLRLSLLVYLHFSGLLFAAALYLILLARLKHGEEELIPLWRSATGFFLLTLPAAALAVVHTLRYPSLSWLPEFSLATTLDAISGSLLWYGSLSPVQATMLLSLACLGGVRLYHVDRQRWILLVGWWLAPLACAILLACIGPNLLHPRYQYYSLPPFLMLAAIGLNSLQPKLVRYAALAVMATLSLTSLGRHHEQVAQTAALREQLLALKDLQSKCPIVHLSKCGFVLDFIYRNNPADTFLAEGTGEANVLRHWLDKNPYISDREISGLQCVEFLRLPCHRSRHAFTGN